jgi:hypothetical protein
MVPDEQVALAGCRRTRDGAPDDVYPDRDAAPLQAALLALGAPSVLVAWDDPSVAWETFSKVVVSSTWDSVDRAPEYLSWARAVGAATVLVNDASVLEWGLDKRHQQELEAAGVPVIPTTWVTPGTPWQPPTAGRFVVKPAVSAGGRSTVCYEPGDPASLVHVQGLHGAGQTAMVQEYLEAINRFGELDVIFIDGVFSHAVKKQPLLEVGRAAEERPWERLAWDGLAEPEDSQLELAQFTVGVVRERLGAYPVYGRVDLVPDGAGNSLVIEIELVDPYLSFDMDSSGAHRLAAAVMRAEV